MVEILQLLGSSSFMILPERGRLPDARWPLRSNSISLPTLPQRVSVSSSSTWPGILPVAPLVGRQVLYERFFASDPLTRAQFLNTIYPKEELMERIRSFLGRDDDVE